MGFSTRPSDYSVYVRAELTELTRANRGRDKSQRDRILHHTMLMDRLFTKFLCHLCARLRSCQGQNPASYSNFHFIRDQRASEGRMLNLAWVLVMLSENTITLVDWLATP